MQGLGGLRQKPCGVLYLGVPSPCSNICTSLPTPSNRLRRRAWQMRRNLWWILCVSAEPLRTRTQQHLYQLPTAFKPAEGTVGIKGLNLLKRREGPQAN